MLLAIALTLLSAILLISTFMQTRTILLDNIQWRLYTHTDGLLASMMVITWRVNHCIICLLFWLFGENFPSFDPHVA